jgi:AraC-like DNA-binding protein
MRIAAAARALATTHLAISQIAMQYGLCDQIVVTKQFRRRIGMTHMQFPRRQQGEPENGSKPRSG